MTAVMTGALVAAGGMSPASATTGPAGGTGQAQAGPETLGTAGAPVPELDWGPCPADASTPASQEPADYQCATAEVPLSYRRPHGQSIELAVGRLPAADQDHKIGTLFFNPGGPGGSGRIPPKLTDTLHQRFDIVGFDPRGTNASMPVRCFTSTEQAMRSFGWQFPITLAQERDVIDATERGTDLCARNGGPLLSHMSTANVARDMDLLRQAVGDEKMTYFGYSYGTHLGEVYANLFPGKVRALVLDGVLNPIEWTTGREPAKAYVPFTYRVGSFRGAQHALESFLAACAGDQRCAFGEPGGSPKELQGKYDTLLDRLRNEPAKITTPDGQTTTVTYQDAVGLTLSLLYSANASTTLADLLQQLFEATTPQARTRATPPRVDLPSVPKRPTYVAPSASSVPATAPTGASTARPTAMRAAAYTGGYEWFYAVGCLDSSNPGNAYKWPRYARKADQQGRGFGSLWTYRSLPCATWPVSDPDRYAGPWDRDTANPILLVGNSQGDPATPYSDARSTTKLLANARLLTLDSFGHTATGGLSRCIDRRVNRYLIDGKLPPEGTTCQPDRGPFDPAPSPLSRIPSPPPSHSR